MKYIVNLKREGDDYMAGNQRSICVAKGAGSMDHNNRKFIANNVDEYRTGLNITYVKEKELDAYEKCFGDAVREYDAKQTRKNRKIGSSKNYWNNVRTSGNGEKAFYEIIVQVGNMYDSGCFTEGGRVAQKILDEYMQFFQERNPNIYVFNAVMHLDEKTPHLHIDYIPIATGYKNGMSKRNSLDRALKQMGIEVEGKVGKYNNRTIAWENREKDYIEELLHEHGLERAPDKENDREHLSVEEYKAAVEAVENEAEELPNQIEATAIPFTQNVIVKKDDLDKIEKRAKLSKVHEEASKKIREETEKELDEIKEQNLESKEIKKIAKSYLKSATSKADETKYMAEKKAEEIIEAAEKKYAEAEAQKELYIEKYNEQPELNHKYEELQRIHEEDTESINILNDKLIESRKEVASLKSEIVELKNSIESKIKAATAPLEKQIQELKGQLKAAYTYITDIVKASGMLAYDDGVYKVSLTAVQKKLVDAISSFASKKARENGFSDLADDMDKHVDISKEIDSYIHPVKNRELSR